MNQDIAPFEFLNREDVRLLTFNGWTNKNVSIRELAMFGFFWVRFYDDNADNDMTKCVFCKVEIADWQEDDDVLSEHERLSRHCEFLLRYKTNNVPIDAKLLNERLPAATAATVAAAAAAGIITPGSTVTPGIDVCGTQCMTLQETRVQIHFLTYATERVRQFTFKNWPIAMPIKAEKLYKSGFFYTGKGDCVICYHCGLCLDQWLKNDDPMKKHAQLSKHCKFAQKIINTKKYQLKKRLKLTIKTAFLFVFLSMIFYQLSSFPNC